MRKRKWNERSEGSCYRAGACGEWEASKQPTLSTALACPPKGRRGEKGGERREDREAKITFVNGERGIAKRFFEGGPRFRCQGSKLKYKQSIFDRELG